MSESEYREAFDRIVVDGSLTDMEKLVHTFDLVTQEYISHYRLDADLARAMGDNDTAVREEIKAGMIQSSRGMFEYCYIRITGRRGPLWDE
jgi:hypothetical protein